eukprot:13248053-Heterocapsa_arctica.AAC.1
MESGHPEEHTRENIPVMETASFVEKNAGVNHVWWDCRALNKPSDFGYLKLMRIRHNEHNQPE